MILALKVFMILAGVGSLVLAIRWWWRGVMPARESVISALVFVLSLAALVALTVGLCVFELSKINFPSPGVPKQGWQRPGWYLVAHQFVVAGPFASQADCNANILIRDEADHYFSCAYLSEQPKWDDEPAQ